ncbi:helix-turn-helix domain-containing protein [Streptomyces abyssomicinicus]|uniref:helix-turn-helix domain-containing protein n=1 Tax=Streptomyces abyssomicinicus TaxID=574929 RepID=UPI0012506CC5
MREHDGVTAERGGDAVSRRPEASDGLKTFGAVLKALREEGGCTQEEFASLVGYSAVYIAKIEQGKRYPPQDLSGRAEDALGATAGKVLRAAARSLDRRPGLASWFQHWAAIEEEAVCLFAYECRAVPGLLQPEGYIRAIFERRLPPLSEEQLAQQVAARLDRQRLLAERPNTTFSFIVEQAVLERRLGGPAVTVELIDNLLAQGGRRNVEILLMPLRQEDHAGVDGQMYLAETPSHEWIGYVEGHDSSMLFTSRELVSAMQHRYGRMRSQALNRADTADRLKRMRGAP